MKRKIKAIVEAVDKNGGALIIANNNANLCEKQNAIRELIGRKELKKANVDSLLFDEQELENALPEGYSLVWTENGDVFIMDEENAKEWLEY